MNVAGELRPVQGSADLAGLVRVDRTVSELFFEDEIMVFTSGVSFSLLLLGNVAEPETGDFALSDVVDALLLNNLLASLHALLLSVGACFLSFCDVLGCQVFLLIYFSKPFMLGS